MTAVTAATAATTVSENPNKDHDIKDKALNNGNSSIGNSSIGNSSIGNASIGNSRGSSIRTCSRAGTWGTWGTGPPKAGKSLVLMRSLCGHGDKNGNDIDGFINGHARKDIEDNNFGNGSQGQCGLQQTARMARAAVTMMVNSDDGNCIGTHKRVS